MPAALIFDLDGTLVDTVYAHVFAWQRAFAEAGMPIDGWRIHRRVGMSGGLFTRAAAREVGRDFSPAEAEALQRRHGELFRELLPDRRPLPGAVQLLADLRAAARAKRPPLIPTRRWIRQPSIGIPSSANVLCHAKTCAYTVSTSVPSRSKISAAGMRGYGLRNETCSRRPASPERTIASHTSAARYPSSNVAPYGATSPSSAIALSMW